MAQLDLAFPRAEDVPPDARHQWARRSFMPGRADEWRCDPCGELATRSVLDASWEFHRPKLAASKSGVGDWATVSHACELRAWN